MALRHSMCVPQCNRVTGMPLATEVLLCKQIIDDFRTHPAPWRHLFGNRVLFVQVDILTTESYINPKFS